MQLVTNRMFRPRSLRKLSRHMQHDSHSYQNLILGIESSCDDTSLALLTIPDGHMVAQSHASQAAFHTISGGINPVFARDLHISNVRPTMADLLTTWTGSGNESVWDAAFRTRVKAIAVTTRPGLPLSLRVGLDLARHLASTYDLRHVIPIHHMEAHALTVRLWDGGETKFPYLCLLLSGGHCILTWVRSAVDFDILGRTYDIAPGDAFDKMARKLGLNYDPKYGTMPGGQAIDRFVTEYAPKEAGIPSGAGSAFNMKIPLSHYRTCNFSFNGILSNFARMVDQYIPPLSETLAGVCHQKAADPPTAKYDLARAFQTTLVDHILQSTRRAMFYCESIMPGLRPEAGACLTLAVSGGVASNTHVRSRLGQLCNAWGWRLACPPPHLCTDNGVMIAWNALERLALCKGNFGELLRSVPDRDYDIRGKCPFGNDMSSQVDSASISMKQIRAHERTKVEPHDQNFKDPKEEDLGDFGIFGSLGG